MINISSPVKNNNAPQQAPNIALAQVNDNAQVISSQETLPLSGEQALVSGILQQAGNGLIEIINREQPLEKLQEGLQKLANQNHKEAHAESNPEQQTEDQPQQDLDQPGKAKLNSKSHIQSGKVPAATDKPQEEGATLVMGKALDSLDIVADHAKQIKAFLDSNNTINGQDKELIAQFDASAKERLEDIRTARQKLQDLHEKIKNRKEGDREVAPQELAAALKEAEEKVQAGLKQVNQLPEQLNQIKGKLQGSGHGGVGDLGKGGYSGLGEDLGKGGYTGQKEDPGYGDGSPNIFGSGLNSIQQMFNAGVSFFALLISALLFGYDVASEAGKLQMLKQAIAQDASKYATDLNGFLSELNELIGQKNGTESDKNLFDFLNSDEGKALLNKYSGLFKAAGFDTDIDWSNPDKGRAQLSNMLNGTIEFVNSKLRSVNASSASIVDGFKTDSNGNIDMDEILSTLTNQKNSCETATAELTTMNNKLTASVNQATETIKSLLDWLKQTIANYGSSVSQR